MKTTFATAAFAGIVAAGKPPLKQNSQFLNFLSRHNKSYDNPHEMAERAKLFAEAQQTIARLNRESAASGRRNAAKFEINYFADLSNDEYKKWLGYKENDPRQRSKLYHQRDNHGRRLIAEATSIDHVALGHMTPVKDQGYCGSCWAFASNTVLEGTVAAMKGTNPIRYSEQHLVDCTLNGRSVNGNAYYNYGCGGGWMQEAWRFQQNEGVMLNTDYPYESDSTYTEGACRHDASKIIGKVTRRTGIDQAGSSIESVKTQLQKGPMTIAIDAGGADFQYYKSGVLTTAQCGLSLNHAVALVGYSDGTTPPNPDPEPEPQPEPTDECTVFKWWHTCPSARRMLADAQGDDNYWKIQNSWGTWWGDQGFVKFEIAEGDGVCGMNAYVEWAEM